MSSPLYTDPLYTQLPVVELFEGRDLTALASTAVTALTFAAISGPIDGPTQAISIATATAGGPTCGVIKFSVPGGTLTGVARGNSRVVRVAAGATLTPGQQVEVGANGTAVPHDTGTAVGYSLDNATTGALAPISLY